MCEPLNMIKQRQQRAKIRTSEILVFRIFAVYMVKQNARNHRVGYR